MNRKDNVDKQLDKLTNDMLKYLNEIEKKCASCGEIKTEFHTNEKCQRIQKRKQRELRNTYRLRGS